MCAVYCHRVSTHLQLTNIYYDVVEIPNLSGQGPFVAGISPVAYNSVCEPSYVDDPSVVE